MTTARRTLDKAMTEAALQDAIVDYAMLHGWRAWHDTDSRRNDAGWPDLVLVRGGELIFAELKTALGQLRPAQLDWLDELRAAGAETVVWRPEDWSSGEIEERLA